MLKRFIELGLAATLTAALGTSVAWAQDEEGFDDESGFEDEGDELGAEDDMDMDAEGDDMDMDAEGDDAEATEGDVSAEAAPGAPAAGDFRAGAALMFPSGFNDEGEIGIGSWAELKLAGAYQVSPELSVGAELPLLLLNQGEVDAFQGIWANGRYQVNEKFHGSAFLGFGPAGRMLINPYGHIGIPGGGGDGKVGFGIGGGVVHHAGKIAINADVNIKAQLESDVNDDMELTTGIVLHVPVGVFYQVNPQLAAGVATGVYSGAGVSFDSEEGMTLPLLAAATYQVKPQIGVGGFLGFSSLMVPEGLGVGDTLSLGVFAQYSK